MRFTCGSLSPEDPGHTPQEPPPNPAKERFINKMQRYNQGLINTEELLSMSGD